MSRLILKYFDIASAAAKLSGVANSFGSLSVRMVVHRDDHLVLLGERRHPLRRRQRASTP